MEITTGAKKEPVRMTDAEEQGLSVGARPRKDKEAAEENGAAQTRRTTDYKRVFQRKGKSLKMRSRKRGSQNVRVTKDLGDNLI